MINKGTVFGNLTVVRRTGNDIYGSRRYICMCQCGTERSVIEKRLLNGKVLSCGCMTPERGYYRNYEGMIILKKKELVDRIKALSDACKVQPTRWVEEVLEDWILKHRSNKVHRSELDIVTEEVGDEDYAMGYLE